MENWKFGPPILVGERVVWLKNDEKASEGGAVRWIGKLSRESKDWTVGIELDNPMPSGGTDGTWGERKLFHCDSRKGVFLPLSRIRKEGSNDKLNNSHENLEERWKRKETSKGRENQFEGTENEIMAERTIKELPKRINNVNEEKENLGNASSDSHELKLEVQNIRKPLRRHRKRSKSPKVVVKKDDYYSGLRRNEIRRPFSLTGKISETSGQSNDKWQKKYESCALEEKYIREFIQREISKHRNGLRDPGIQSKMNDVKGNFKRIDEDEIHGYGSERLNGLQDKPQKKYDGRLNRRSDALNPREKSNGFFSFLKWFRKSKEMPELESGKDSSATSSPLFVRRRSSSCGSVDTLFSIATANSFAFVSPVQYQAVISSSHTTYPIPVENQNAKEAKSRNYSDYENDQGKGSEEVKMEGECSVDSKKKCRAPDPPRDISLPSTLEHKKTNEEDEPEGKGGHRRTVSESFKDKKAGYYCHVQGKRKAPLPPSSVPLYPSLTSLKSQCPSISKKKRPAPPPPDGKENIKANLENVKPNNQAQNSNYDNIPYIPGKSEFLAHEESFKSNGSNLSPLLALKNDISSSPLPSRPWYKRNSSGSNILKKESVKLSERKKNKENDEWMPEVGFSRRPFTNENAHNIFNFLSRLDRSQEKKEEKRKSQVSILANISELDREAAEIVRKGQAQEKKMMADNDEKYYANNNVLSSFPAMPNGADLSKPSEKEEGTQKTTKSPFDEFKPKVLAKKTQDIVEPLTNNPKTKEEDKEEYDASAELDYYINPWNCPKCTLENPGWQKFCEACNMMRVKFRSVKQTENREPEKSPVGKVPDLEQEKKQKEPSPVRARTPKEEKPPGIEEDDPSEDNLEGVRRKRLAFFLSKQSSSRDSTVTEDEDEKTKLKIMLKEMKNSLPKREKGVINNAALEGTLIEAAAGTNAGSEEGILGSRDETLGDAESKRKEFSNMKVQQTWQPITNESNKYGAIKKRREVTPSDTAEAIIVTKTTILEDIIVKKGDKGQKVSSSAQTNSNANDGYHGLDKGPTEHTYTNVESVRGRAEVVDLSAPENTFTNGDIEAITAKLQREGAGLADYKVDIQSTAETNTMNVNRLLKKLEAAINTGHHLEAANIAKELARMKVSCSVNRQNVVHDPSASKIIVDLYIEDKVSHKGPIQIKILSSLTLAQLKTKVEREWNIPRNVQRWILGKQLATDEDKTLEQHGVVSNSSPLFLYIVTPEQGGEQSGGCLKKIPEPVKIDRRNGKILYAEARRPSLIIEEDSESSSEDSGKNPEKESREIPKTKPPESPKLSTPGARRREAFRKRDSQSSSSFEKREVNEQLKKELKVITVNSVKDRIEKLYRAASGKPGEGTEPSGWKPKDNSPNKQKGHYNELMQLENADLVPNTEEFECPVCLVGYAPGEGVVLKDCLHTFCRPCLVNTIQFNEEAEVKCPYRDDKYSCESVLQQREIKSLVSKGLFEQHLAKSVSVAENKIGNAYHCKTPDCKGWCILEDNVNEFHCPVCKATNCLTCQSIHTGMNCRQYQEQIEFASDTNAEAKKTRDMLQEMVEKGEAMACPTCQVVLMKKWGCDWLRCSMCKTEICWVTRGPRWGPGGKGDTSGGCQCGVNGVKCHPKCNYCH